MRFFSSMLIAVSIGACGGTTQTTTSPAEVDPSSNEAPPEETTPPPEETTADPTLDPTSSLEAPLQACGPGQSYELVAHLACPDGSVPLGGDPGQGSRARQGSSGSHAPPADPMDLANSHIVDIYELPCPSGPIEVFVCMYHCPEGQSAIP